MAPVFVISLIGLLVAGLGWLIWMNHHLVRSWFGGHGEEAGKRTAKVVLGMDVTPESLPADVISAARGLYGESRIREAFALLYRAAISHCITVAHIGIRESDTEGDCVRRVAKSGENAQPEFFQGLTHAWIDVQYARIDPGSEVFERLCAGWPYAKERGGAA